MLASTRRLVGAALAVIAAVAAVWSAFIDWYGGRNGSDIRLQDLFNQITFVTADSLGSLFIPMGLSALLVLVGVVVGRWLWVVAGLIAIATPFLWGLRQAQSVTSLHANLVGNGPATAVAAGALMLIAAAVSTRAPAREKAAAPAHARTADPAAPAADQWSESGQAYQQGYEQAADQTVDQSQTLDETISHKREG
jgi:hypothetical protein